MCGLAIVIILLTQQKPYWPTLFSGLSLPYQALIGFTIGGLYWAAVTLIYRFSAGRNSSRHMPEKYRRLDLHGWNPLWMALAAGFGEELLFRGALQPIVGIWATSLLFVLAHTRAYSLNGFSKRVLLQGAGLFAISVAFGFIAKYFGLITAVIVHVSVDMVGLFAIRRALHPQVAAAT